jgi:hypothetical protein
MPAPKVQSKDPAQKKLRDDKQGFNHSYKSFSQKLKAFKDGLNGRGNAKAGLPPSNIKEPMPGEISSYLSGLAGEFQTLVGNAEKIIAQQAQYSRTRRRRKPKAPNQPTTAPATAPAAPTAPEQDKVVDTLSRLGFYENAIEKIASSKLSRFWEYATAIFSTKEFNRQRVGLLSQSADLYYSILDLENDVLSLSISNIPNTIAKYKKFKYNFDAFLGTFSGVEAMVERRLEQKGVKKPTDEKKPTEQPPAQPGLTEKTQDEEGYQSLEPQPIQKNPVIEAIRNDMHILFNASLAKKEVKDLDQLLDRYDAEEDQHLKAGWETQIKNCHAMIAQRLSNEVQKRYGPANIKSMQDIINLIKKNKQDKKAQYISDEMIKTAHNSITRYLKKKLVKSIPFNKTAPVRLEIVEALDDMKITIKSVMDNLEKDLSIEELKVLLKKLQEDKDRVKRPLHILNTFFMKDFFTKRENSKRKQKNKGKDKNEPFYRDDEELMDQVMQRKLKRELGNDLG